MTKADVRPKTIVPNQILGQQGEATVNARVHAMGFLFYPTGGVEAGIDGFIEIRDADNNQVKGRLLQVQVKTREDRAYTAETDESFEYLCEPGDIAYWRDGSLPTIVVLHRVSDNSLYWKQAPRGGSPHDLEARRLRIDKNNDRFDKSAADAIAAIAVEQALPGLHMPPSRQPDELFLNMVKVILPETIQLASTTYRHGREANRALLDIEDRPPTEWVVKGGQLLTFLDIDNCSLRHVVDRGSIEVFPVEQFALCDEDDDQHIFIHLLKRTLIAQLDPLLAWRQKPGLFYFPADPQATDRTYRYESLKKETSREVVKAKKKQDGRVSYVRHSAFIPRFFCEFDEWYLSVEPTYFFTWDGSRPDRYAGERISRLKRLENNSALRGQFIMWRQLLTAFGQEPMQSSFLAEPSPPPILRFAPLDLLTLPYSVPDDIWRSRDANAPDTSEELPL